MLLRKIVSGRDDSLLLTRLELNDVQKRGMFVYENKKISRLFSFMKTSAGKEVISLSSRLQNEKVGNNY